MPLFHKIMSLLWYTLSTIIYFFLAILLLFFLFAIIPHCSLFGRIMSHIVLRFDKYILILALPLITLLLSETSNIISAQHREAEQGKNKYIERSNNMYSQRNFFMILLGLVAMLGTLLISRETVYWENRVKQVKCNSPATVVVSPAHASELSK